MRFALVTVLAAAALVAAAPTINTPSSLPRCIPTLLQWSGGQAPYFVTVNQGGSESAVIQTLLQSTSDTSYSWTPNLPVGTSVTLAVRDSTGVSGFSQQVSVGQGLDNCGSSSAAAGGASSGSAAPSSSASASSAASTSSSASSTSASSTSAATTSSISTSSSIIPSSTRPLTSATAAPTNAAGMNAANVGAAVGVAAIAAAFF